MIQLGDIIRHNEGEIHVRHRGAEVTMSLDEAAKLDKPEGVVIVEVSAILLHQLIRYRRYRDTS